MKKQKTIKKITGLLMLTCFMTLGLLTANAQAIPDPSASLELNAPKKGALLPRLSLTSLTDKASIEGGNPTTSLLLFNTNAALEGGMGFYYWDGAAWKKLSASGDTAKIKTINSSYTVADSDYTLIASGLTGDITITLPAAAANLGRILIINQNNVANSSGNEVTVKFNTAIKYSDQVSQTELIAPFYAAATGGTLKITLQSDGTNWCVVSSL